MIDFNEYHWSENKTNKKEGFKEFSMSKKRLQDILEKREIN